GVELECARSTGSRRITISLAAGSVCLIRRIASRSYRYSGVDSPRSVPGGAASDNASYSGLRQTCSREGSASPGPALAGGGAALGEDVGSLTADMKSPGCRASVACSAVVPAFGAPITRKSGMDTGSLQE